MTGIHKGCFRRQIAEASDRFSEECENHDRIIVGVNEDTDKDEGRPIDILQIGHEVESDQITQPRVHETPRQGRRQPRLQTIRESARNNENVMPALVNGLLANCTLGEMAQAMADVYGHYPASRSGEHTYQQCGITLGPPHPAQSPQAPQGKGLLECETTARSEYQTVYNSAPDQLALSSNL